MGAGYSREADTDRLSGTEHRTDHTIFPLGVIGTAIAARVGTLPAPAKMCACTRRVSRGSGPDFPVFAVGPSAGAPIRVSFPDTAEQTLTRCSSGELASFSAVLEPPPCL